MDIAEFKSMLRKRIREQRRSLSDEERALSAKAVAERIEALEGLKGARFVLAYMPMKYELDILPAVERLKARGITPVFPLCTQNNGLRLLIPAEKNGFITGAYGIMEPDESRAREIAADELDAIILPAIGFDAAGRRLGQGGGYYDRLLARCSCLTIAAGFDCQLIPEVPVEETDKTVDIVVTPSKTLLI